MKLSEWAKKNSITYRTAWEHFRTGKIPGAYKLQSGTIVVPDGTEEEERTVVYARVSSSQNKRNMDSQADRLVSFCNARGWSVEQVVKEVGSGLNDSRKKLLDILHSGAATRLVVEHSDRLARFGVPYIRECCRHFGCELVIVNQTDGDKEDLIQDFVSVITSFCARIYGRRRSRRKTEKLIKELETE